ncbi:hypothetical protein AMS62_19505 [Bacillus sp. FJAT-18019]|nr:hypothetical protein AMS62_19505 [Bacillus sp. FJAT-18019]
MKIKAPNQRLLPQAYAFFLSLSFIAIPYEKKDENVQSQQQRARMATFIPPEFMQGYEDFFFRPYYKYTAWPEWNFHNRRRST